MMIYAYKERRLEHTFQLRDRTGVVVEPASDDIIRLSLGKLGAVAKLQFTSAAATANGSSITKNTPTSGYHKLILDPADVNFDPGVYTCIFDYKDVDDGSDWESGGRHVFVLGAS